MIERRPQNPKRLLRLAFAVLLLLVGGGRDAHAEGLEPAWTFSSYLELSSNTLYVSDDSSSTTLHSIGVAAGLDFTSDRSPWTGGVFADYHESPNHDIDGMINAGAYLRYGLGRWDSTSFVVRSVPPEVSGLWLYGTGLRYHIVDGHKLGAHATAAAGRPDSTTLVIRYSADLGHGFSLNLTYGVGVDSSRHRLASAQLSWEVF